jgi:hypothetical protein
MSPIPVGEFVMRFGNGLKSQVDHTAREARDEHACRISVPVPQFRIIGRG